MNDLIFCAEIGSNWQGDIDICKYLYDKAKESGSTHVKMQFYPCDELYDESWKFYKMAKKCELSYDTARILKEYADKIGIGWFASVHTKEDIDFLIDIKAPFIKIKASQVNDSTLIKTAIDTGIKTILSNPNSMITSWKGVINLLTTDKYPSKFEDIPFYELSSRNCEGFSDHTQGIQASLCAAMFPNIFIFERHFTDRLKHPEYKNKLFGVDETKTPDWCVSIYPHQFREMVEKIKWIKQRE